MNQTKRLPSLKWNGAVYRAETSRLRVLAGVLKPPLKLAKNTGRKIPSRGLPHIFNGCSETAAKADRKHEREDSRPWPSQASLAVSYKPPIKDIRDLATVVQQPLKVLKHPKRISIFFSFFLENFQRRNFSAAKSCFCFSGPVFTDPPLILILLEAVLGTIAKS